MLKNKREDAMILTDVYLWTTKQIVNSAIKPRSKNYYYLIHPAYYLVLIGDLIPYGIITFVLKL